MITRKILLILFVAVVGAFTYYVVIPYIDNFQKQTLPKQIAVEISSNEKKPVLVSLATTTFMVNLAVTNTEREKGLGNSSFLGDTNGLLFVYENESYPAIWMKNMAFPIDIAWLNKDLRIVHIERNISPDTYPAAFRSDLPAQYVLEMNAGFFDKYGIDLGETLRLVEGE